MPREPIGPVIAGVDGTPAAAGAVDLAAQEAEARGAALVLVHAGAAPASGPLDVALARVRRAHPGCSVTAELVEDDPADALAARSPGASAVVLGRGDRGRRRAGQSRHGSVVWRVLALAESPVIVCPPHSPTAPGAPLPVLVCVDGVPASEAVEFSFAEAAWRGAPLLAIHVPALAAGGTPLPDAEVAVVELLERWSGKYPAVPVRLAVRRGLDSVIVFAAASQSAGLAVAASRHPIGTHRVPRGSALAAFIERSACAVAVLSIGVATT